jgi:hypothetical protein
MARPVIYGMTTTQKAELWHRWRKGESTSDISLVLGKFRSSVVSVLKVHSGFMPPVRRQQDGITHPLSHLRVFQASSFADMLKCNAYYLEESDGRVFAE